MGACVSSGTPVASSTSSSRFPRWRRQRVFSACVRSTRPALLFFDGRHWQVDVPRLRVGVQRLRVESMNRVPPVRTQGGDSIHRVHFTHFNDDDERTQLHIVGSFADSASQASVPNSYTGDVFLLRCQGGDLVLLTQVSPWYAHLIRVADLPIGSDGCVNVSVPLGKPTPSVYIQPAAVCESEMASRPQAETDVKTASER